MSLLLGIQLGNWYGMEMVWLFHELNADADALQTMATKYAAALK